MRLMLVILWCLTLTAITSEKTSAQTSAPHLPNIAALKAISPSPAYAGGVWVDSYDGTASATVGTGSSSPVFYWTVTTGTCSFPDNGTEVSVVGGCAYLARQAVYDLRIWGVSNVASTSSTIWSSNVTAMKAAIGTMCGMTGPYFGGQLHAAPGTYDINDTIALSCNGLTIECDNPQTTTFVQHSKGSGNTGIDTFQLGVAGTTTTGIGLINCGVQNADTIYDQTAGALVHFIDTTNGIASGLSLTGAFFRGIVIEGTSYVNGNSSGVSGTITIANTSILPTKSTSCAAYPCAPPKSSAILIERSTANGEIPANIVMSNVSIDAFNGTMSYGLDLRSVSGLQISNMTVQGADIANFHFYPEIETGAITGIQWQNVSGIGNGTLGKANTEYGMYFEWNEALSNFNTKAGLKGSFGNIRLNNYSLNGIYVGLGWENGGGAPTNGGEPVFVSFDGCAIVDAQEAGVVITSGSQDWTFGNCTVAGNSFVSAAPSSVGGKAGNADVGTIATTAGSTNVTITTSGRAPVSGDYLSALGIQTPSTSTAATLGSMGGPNTTVLTISCSPSTPPSTCTGTMSTIAFGSTTSGPLSYGTPLAIGTISTSAGSNAVTIKPASGQPNPVGGNQIYAAGVPSPSSHGPLVTLSTMSPPSCTGTPVTCTATMSTNAISTQFSVPATYGYYSSSGQITAAAGSHTFTISNPYSNQRNPVVGDQLSAPGIPSAASNGVATYITAAPSCSGTSPNICTATMSSPAYETSSSTPLDYGAIYATWTGTITTTNGSPNFVIHPLTGTSNRAQRNPIVGDNLYAKSVPSSTSFAPYTTITSVNCTGTPVSCTGTMSNNAYFGGNLIPLTFGGFFPNYQFSWGQRISINGGSINCGGLSAFGIVTTSSSPYGLLGLAVHNVGFSDYSGADIACIQPMILGHANASYDNIGGNFNYPVIQNNGSGSYEIVSSNVIYVDPTYDAALISGTTTITTIDATPSDYVGRAAWDGRRVILTFESSVTINIAGNIITPTRANFGVTAGQSCAFSYMTPFWYLIGCSG